LPTPPRIAAAGHSHPGRQRRRNEDAFAVRLDLGLFVVADGMGGHSGGEVASRLAVDAVADHIHAAVAIPPGTASRVAELLTAAVQRANQAVVGAARSKATENDMGTTIAAVLARGDRAAVAHVGDSRVYRYRAGHLERLTDDHSLLAECLRSGYLTPDLAGAFPYKHLVTRSLGADELVEVDVRVIEPLPGDVVMVCSDGLSGVVDDAEIARHLDAEPDLGEAARRLVDRANERGGPDNVTVVLARWLA
jgi:serine/threonine protein phosphatase PrpC